MSEKDPAKPGRSQRLGSLSAGNEPATGRLGALRTGGPERPGSERPAAASPTTGSSSSSAPKKRNFAPKVPARRKVKTESAAGPAGAAAPLDTATDDFKALIQNAQNDANWRASRGRGRGRGRGMPANQGPAEVVLAGNIKSEGKPGVGRGAGGGCGSGTGGGGSGAPGFKGSSGSAAGPSGSRTMGKVLRGVDAAMAGMDIDTDELDAQNRGPLDYGQYYPTMLPFLPPEEEAELQGEQAVETATADPIFSSRESDGNVGPHIGLPGEYDLSTAESFVLQLPPGLPLPPSALQPHAAVKMQRLLEAQDSDEEFTQLRVPSLDQVLPGKLGRLKVQKSGKVKARLADGVEFVLSQGIATDIRQDMWLHGGREDSCCLGAIDKRIVVTPDIMHLLKPDDAEDKETLSRV